MALLKIARMGHPVLRRRARRVADPTAPELRQLAQSMIETMLDAPGVGLAAPQVHADLRLLVYRVPASRSPHGTPLAPTALVNPEIEPVEQDVSHGWEGCLSIPGVRGIVPRWRTILVRGQTLEGTRIEQIAEGFHARVIQHELDHLDGTLFIDRMPDLALLSFEDQLHHFEQDDDQDQDEGQTPG